MAGSRGDTEDRLRARGKAALATVLSARYKAEAPVVVAPGEVVPDDLPWLWEMRVRVQPEDERRFDATVEGWRRSISERPYVGTIVPVLYDPSDHRAVAYDRRGHALHIAWHAETARVSGLAADESAVAAIGTDNVLRRAASLERRRALRGLR
jgi:hypothetical protein